MSFGASRKATNKCEYFEKKISVEVLPSGKLKWDAVECMTETRLRNNRTFNHLAVTFTMCAGARTTTRWVKKKVP